MCYNERGESMTVRHPGISLTNDLVAKKIFSNPEITCQFIRDMLDLPAKNIIEPENLLAGKSARRFLHFRKLTDGLATS